MSVDFDRPRAVLRKSWRGAVCGATCATRLARQPLVRRVSRSGRRAMGIPRPREPANPPGEVAPRNSELDVESFVPRARLKMLAYCLVLLSFAGGGVNAAGAGSAQVGETCASDSDCYDGHGCAGGRCCASTSGYTVTNCQTCGTDGKCLECEPGYESFSWSGATRCRKECESYEMLKYASDWQCQTKYADGRGCSGNDHWCSSGKCGENYCCSAAAANSSTGNECCSMCGSSGQCLKYSSCITTPTTSLSPCDASTAPANGGVGNCTNSLPSGSTCQPTCNSGYTVSGTTSCSLGTLTAANCTVTPSPSSSSSCSSSRATGGNVTTFGDYVIHSFTSSGTFEVTDSTLTEVDVLVVGGGAGGAGGDNNNWGGVAVEEGRSFPSAGLLSRRGVTASESATVETAKLSSLLTLQQQTAAIASLTVTLRLVVALLRCTDAEETVALKSLVEMVMIRQVAAAAVQGPTALT
jgi:hypothetical protein